MALGGNDAQAAKLLDLGVQRLLLGLQRGDLGFLGGVVQGLVGLDQLDVVLDVAAQHDVGAAARHVGGDGHHARQAGVGDDVGFLLVLARV